MYAFHLEVPAGAATLDVAFDFISPPESGGFTSGASTTTELAVLNWNQLLLYPQGSQPDAFQYQATLTRAQLLALRHRAPHRARKRQPDRVPAGFAHHHGRFPRLRRRPLPHLRIGRRNREPRTTFTWRPIATAPWKPAPSSSAISRVWWPKPARCSARHYRGYHFLYTLSDHVAHFGLEHHESSDDRTGERTLIDPDTLRASGYLLPTNSCTPGTASTAAPPA
jgi:hypothetical protein